MKRQSAIKLAYAAVCLALCLILPTALGHIGQVGKILCPMHLPVLLCGFLCGWPYGLAVGALAPLLSSVLTGMPVLYPTGLTMMFELAVYGTVSALLYRALPKRVGFVYLALIAAMVAGRLCAGVVNLALLSLGALETYTLQIFLTTHFVTALPGIVCHIVLVPAMVLALRRAGLMPEQLARRGAPETA